MSKVALEQISKFKRATQSSKPLSIPIKLHCYAFNKGSPRATVMLSDYSPLLPNQLIQPFQPFMPFDYWNQMILMRAVAFKLSTSHIMSTHDTHGTWHVRQKWFVFWKCVIATTFLITFCCVQRFRQWDIFKAFPPSGFPVIFLVKNEAVKQLGATPLSTNEGKMLLCKCWHHLLSHGASYKCASAPIWRLYFLLGATSACCVLAWHTHLIMIDRLIKSNCAELRRNPRKEESVFS